MSLEVHVINAVNLPNVETFGKSDPYVRLEFHGVQKRSTVKDDELNPTWNEKFEFDLSGRQISSDDVLEVQVKDHEKIGRSRLLGQFSIALRDLTRPGRNQQQMTLKLKDGNQRELEAILKLGLTYKPPAGAEASTSPSVAAQESATPGTVVGEEEGEEGDEEEYVEEPQEPLPDGTVPPPKKRKKTKATKSRAKLSTKPQDFQVRVKVVEARQLPGANISPIARVTCYNQTKQSRAAKSTNAPFFNEVFYFNFFQSPAELFDETITFGVYNSRKLRSDAFIGSFKCDIGLVYDEEKHTLLNKWLLLSDPDDAQGGAKGYLKVCVSVLGAGDEVPVLSSFKTTQDADEDIEANLLRPAGVQLRAGMFKLKVYQAEDLPRMDSDIMQGVKSFFGSKQKKELVDPYFVFSFAGKKVVSKTLYNNDHPDFNQELRLGLRFPSMCERIKLQMFDWDRITDQDSICETRLELRTMSHSSDSEALADALLGKDKQSKSSKKKKKDKKRSKKKSKASRKVSVEPGDIAVDIETPKEEDASSEDEVEWVGEGTENGDQRPLVGDPQDNSDYLDHPQEKDPLLNMDDEFEVENEYMDTEDDDGGDTETPATDAPLTEERAEPVNEDVTKSVSFKASPEDIEVLASGFLPTFGPCFVTFYGSPREFSELPDEYENLNFGKGEGVAYRGRALVELSTELGELPETAVADITNDDVLRVQKYMRRRKFRLHAAFVNATMISALDAPVEFEVSIGNYGNKLDENVPPCSSTTQPTNAVFDGNNYYFLPWGENKPCCVVDSHWEDISFRLEALNLLLACVARLEENLERVKVAMRANLATPQLAQLMIKLLDELTHDVSKPLPQAELGLHVETMLDKQMRSFRLLELEYIRTEAEKLRDNATDMTEAVGEVEGFLAQLQNMSVEPQNSMPDVIIWMLCGDKRIAYHRCPAHQLLWSENPDCRGSLCGKLSTISLKYPDDGDDDAKRDIPALVRVRLWLGLEKYEKEWHHLQTEGEFAVYAETYENQICVLGTWTNKGTTKWSDVTKKLKLPKEGFEPPPGWRWASEWYISPELSMLFDKDAGHSRFLEDVYECQSRYPGRPWGAATVPWTDVKGDQVPGKEEAVLPEGWIWEDGWQVDLNRAVDEEGFEYTVEMTMAGWGPVCKNYHLCRRRRWVRARKLVKKPSREAEEAKIMQEKAEGWEYAAPLSKKFHHKERRMDAVRRRRWHRKMVCEQPGAPCFFNIPRADSDSDSDDEEQKRLALTAPRMFLTCNKPEKYQLRAYIYQARDLVARDSSGLSDPYTHVVFVHQSQSTEKVMKSLCPTWDQTLIFDSVEIHGTPGDVARDPPQITIELFDYDSFGEAEFLGRTTSRPLVRDMGADDGRSAVLQWFPITRGGQRAGELLAAFELFQLPSVHTRQQGDVRFSQVEGKDLPFLPPKRGNLYIVPSGIRPQLQRTGLEIMCWGVRNMRKFQLASVTSPSVEIEVGGHVVQTKVIKDTKRNPNFDEPVLFLDVMLPREELYMPPLNIRVRDNRQFGRKPLVGIHTVTSLEPYRCDPTKEGANALEFELPAALRAPEGGAGVQSTSDIVIDIPSDERSPISEKDRKKLEKKQNKLEKMIKQSRSFVDKVNYESLQGGSGGAGSTNGDLSVDIDEQSPALQNFRKLTSNVDGITKATAAQIAMMAEVADQDIDWWSKYYASFGEMDKCKHYLEHGYDRLEVFPCELERVGAYKDFSDFCDTFELLRGKAEEDEESSVVGEFKGSFRVYPLPDDPGEEMPPRVLSNLPSSGTEECVVRIYIVNALDLQPNDPSGLADPYVQIKLGKNKMDTREKYVPNSLNPVFGRYFEMKAVLPLDKDLEISIRDYDLLGSDDTIGVTSMDLENRLLSKYNALVGLPKTYCVSGPNTWRDGRKPKELLEAFCTKHHIATPVYNVDAQSVRIGAKTYRLADFEVKRPAHTHLGASDQRLALHLLNALPTAVGVHLVPEHVETRPLYNPLQPGIEQGKIQMWVDIFPKSLGEPGPPVDITPRVPKQYVLRVVIYNTVDVVLDEESITGEQMSDIYVKGWVAGIDEKQETDVHYRSMDGEGNFNWRFVFPFDYLPAEETVIVKKKEHFWKLDEMELRVPPVLMVQIWDNDKFSADDFLGTVELKMNAMPKPAKKASACSLKQLEVAAGAVAGGPDSDVISLFEQRRLRGFWPVYSDETGEKVLTGKVEMEVELVTLEESVERPAGVARDDPNDNPHLDPPQRPETSFLWFTSPWKTLKHIIWKNYKWYFISAILIILLVLFVILFIYAVPGHVVDKIFNL